MTGNPPRFGDVIRVSHNVDGYVPLGKDRRRWMVVSYDNYFRVFQTVVVSDTGGYDFGLVPWSKEALQMFEVVRDE